MTPLTPRYSREILCTESGRITIYYRQYGGGWEVGVGTCANRPLPETRSTVFEQDESFDTHTHSQSVVCHLHRLRHRKRQSFQSTVNFSFSILSPRQILQRSRRIQTASVQLLLFYYITHNTARTDCAPVGPQSVSGGTCLFVSPVVIIILKLVVVVVVVEKSQSEV